MKKATGFSISLLTLCISAQAQTLNGRWSEAKANEWYAKQPWLVGANFQPSTAINQLEMFQAETFDAATIDKELGWARKIVTPLKH